MKLMRERGKFPDSPDFDPQTEGYKPLREPPAKRAMVYAYILGFACAALALFGVVLANQPLQLAILSFGLWLIGALIVLIPVHELLHAVLFPDFKHTIFGVLPQYGAVFAYYEGTMSRRRMVCSLLFPTIILTLLPLCLMLCGILHEALLSLMLVNTLSCGGDLLGAFLILTRAPRGCMVRNKGYQTYYKHYSSWRGRPAP